MSILQVDQLEATLTLSGLQTPRTLENWLTTLGPIAETYSTDPTEAGSVGSGAFVATTTLSITRPGASTPFKGRLDQSDNPFDPLAANFFFLNPVTLAPDALICTLFGAGDAGPLHIVFPAPVKGFVCQIQGTPGIGGGVDPAIFHCASIIPYDAGGLPLTAAFTKTQNQTPTIVVGDGSTMFIGCAHEDGDTPLIKAVRVNVQVDNLLGAEIGFAIGPVHYDAFLAPATTPEPEPPELTPPGIAFVPAEGGAEELGRDGKLFLFGGPQPLVLRGDPGNDAPVTRPSAAPGVVRLT